MKLRAFFLFAINFLLLTSCGFHLQQGRILAPPLHKLLLKTPDPYGMLTKNLQQILQLSNIELVSNAEAADTILDILSDSNTQELLSVSNTQQTRQYNLGVEVVFQITDKHQRIIVPAQRLSEKRVITIQSNQILGSSNEAMLFYQQMRRSLAISIINRIASTEVTEMINRRLG